MAGALHGLLRASELGYTDARSRPAPAGMASEFGDTLAALANGAEPPQMWLAGFFFNSAIMRLAALNERLPESRDVAAAIRRSVNLLKHRADAHISGQRPITFAQAAKGAEDLCSVLVADMQ